MYKQMDGGSWWAQMVKRLPYNVDDSITGRAEESNSTSPSLLGEIHGWRTDDPTLHGVTEVETRKLMGSGSLTNQKGERSGVRCCSAPWFFRRTGQLKKLWELTYQSVYCTS